jgi:hypothetical protein
MSPKEQRAYDEALRRIEECRRKEEHGTVLDLTDLGLSTLHPEIGQLSRPSKNSPLRKIGLGTCRISSTHFGIRFQAQLIEDLLDMSRIISGKVRLDMQMMDLSAVLFESIETLRATAEAKGVRLKALKHPFQYRSPAIQITFSRFSGTSFITPLSSLPKDGTVRVRLQRFDSFVEVTVTDTGVGIAPDFSPHVFERLQQGYGSTTRRHGGLGLGLAIVKQLVELHGGNVRVKSDGIGQGATFTIHLPTPERGYASQEPAFARREPAFVRNIPRQCSRAGGGR